MQIRQSGRVLRHPKKVRARLAHPRRARTIWLQIASKFEPLWDG